MALTKEQFEDKCIEVIEKVVLVDIKQTRMGAVAVADKLVNKAKEKYPKEIVEIYERVVDEFKNCTDQEYEILKKQLFSKK